MTHRVSILLAALVLGPALWAQQHPNGDRGFSPERVYAFQDIDAINTFNGNLIITIPIGQTYPVNALSYGLKLVYNGTVWDHERSTYPPTNAPCTQSVPSRRSNAGIGWMLSLGR